MSNTYTLEEVQAFSKNRQEAPVLAEKRAQAFKDSQKLDYPFIERAEYTRWMALDHTGFDQAGKGTTDKLPLDDQAKIGLRVFQDQSLEARLPQDLQDKGLVLARFADADPDLIAKYYMTATPADANKINAEHAAFLNAGVILYVPKNTVIEDPINLNFINDASQKLPFNAHVLVVGDVNSDFTLVEKWGTEGDEEVSGNVIVEIIGRKNAQIKYVSIDNFGAKTHVFFQRFAHVKGDANVDFAVANMSDGDAVMDISAELVEAGAESDVKVVSLTHGKQRMIVNSHTRNVVGNTVANIFQHGVVLEESRLTFNGIGKIEKGASQAQAEQESRLLMLSENSRGDANPILLIDEFDVIAGHAGSAGQIDDEQLYYLMSRGIPKKDAEKLAIRGFLGPVIQAIPVESSRQELIDTIEGKLATL